MEITLDAINIRMQTLAAQAENLKANLQATYGAIQDCEYWLSAITEEAKEQV